MDRFTPPSPEQLKIFGRLLRDRRNLAKLSRTKLAQRAKLSDSTIKFIEVARHPPSRATLLRLVGVPELGLRWADLPGVSSEATPAALEKSEDARFNTATVIEMLRVLDELRASQPVVEITARGSVRLCHLCGARSKILAPDREQAAEREPPFRHAPTCAAQLAQDFYARHPLLAKLADQEQLRAAEESRQSTENLGEQEREKIPPQ